MPLKVFALILPVGIGSVFGNDEFEFREASNGDFVASGREHQQLFFLLQSKAMHHIPEPPKGNTKTGNFHWLCQFYGSNLK